MATYNSSFNKQIKRRRLINIGKIVRYGSPKLMQLQPVPNDESQSIYYYITAVKEVNVPGSWTPPTLP